MYSKNPQILFPSKYTNPHTQILRYLGYTDWFLPTQGVSMVQEGQGLLESCAGDYITGTNVTKQHAGRHTWRLFSVHCRSQVRTDMSAIVHQVLHESFSCDLLVILIR